MNIGLVGVIVGESGRHRREGRVRGAGVNGLVEPGRVVGIVSAGILSWYGRSRILG